MIPKKNKWKLQVPYSNHGSLHHAVNLFREKDEFEKPVRYKDKDGKTVTVTYKDKDGNQQELTDPYSKKNMPFLIKNYTIYKSWIERPAAVKILFTHATSICPKPNISEGEINNVFSWKNPELCFGTFDYRRDEILQHVEQGKLNIIVGGHSHRNLVMRVDEKKKDLVEVLAAGETMNTAFMEPKHIALVTSSGGPFPTDLPGGPMICACTKQNKYTTGFYADWDASLIPPRLKKLYSAQDDSKKIPLDKDECPDCHMSATEMVRKPARRHRPGGNLLLFDENGKVKIQSVIPDLESCKTRNAVMCEEQGVFVGAMQLEEINSLREFQRWKYTKPLRIISEKPFTYYGYMVFPKSVKYITFSKGILPGKDKVEPISKEYSNRFFKFIQEDILNNQFEYRVLQEAVKDSFDTLFQAATHKSDFAFTRYSFNEDSSDLWDREINIGKKKREDVKEYAKVQGNNSLESSKKWIAEKFNKTYEPKYKEYHEDDFRGMLMKFRTIPDFKKRKKANVCGY